ncbi:MAG: hypothetical protein ACUVR7_01280 [Armatimonadota bacterium]
MLYGCGADDLLLPYMIDLSIFHHITDVEVIDHIGGWGAFSTRGKSLSTQRRAHSRREAPFGEHSYNGGKGMPLSLISGCC